MRAELTVGDLVIELENNHAGLIDFHASYTEYESAIGELSIEDAKDLRRALDMVIGAAEHS